MSDAVLDAGPLIHLAELGALDVLSDLELLLIPDSVWVEVDAHQPQALMKSELPLQRETVQLPSANLVALAQALMLDQGEIDALSIMETFPHAIFLTDDAAARLAAEQRGYQVYGTIGLLIRSVRKGYKTPKQVIKFLRSIPSQSTLFIRPGLLDAILQHLKDEWKIK